jgi:hypothetical protein
LKRITPSGENDSHRVLLAECLEACTALDEVQRERLQGFLNTEQYQEVRPLTTTTHERSIERCFLRGKQKSALRQLEVKFGPLSSAVKQRVEALSREALVQLQPDLLQAQSLKELRLDG